MEEEKKVLKKSSISRKLLYIIIPIFLISLVFFGWVVKEKVLPQPKVHYHAGFIVVKDNQLINFSDVKYQNFEPCKSNQNDKEPETPERFQLEKAHLHDYVGDVVHVENKSSKWADLFTNLRYSINYQETTAFINGKQVSGFQSQQIKPYDSLVVFIDNTSNKDSYLAQAVTKQHIQEAEKKSENCGM